MIVYYYYLMKAAKVNASCSYIVWGDDVPTFDRLFLLQK